LQWYIQLYIIANIVNGDAVA